MQDHLTSTDRREELRARIALNHATGIGPVRTRRLLSTFGSASAVVQANDSRLREVDGIGRKAIAEIAIAVSSPFCDEEVARAGDYTLLSVLDEAYPPLLSQIYDPPALLWADGDMGALRGPAIAVVGTRKASSEGKRTAYSIAYHLALQGYVIVSGLAYGIDRMAHEGALDAGGLTVAVLGSGLMQVYPTYHRGLANKIRQSGTLISEFSLRTRPEPGHFPRRNRIVSGLSMATVVVEAHERGAP